MNKHILSGCIKLHYNKFIKTNNEMHLLIANALAWKLENLPPTQIKFNPKASYRLNYNKFIKQLA